MLRKQMQINFNLFYFVEIFLLKDLKHVTKILFLTASLIFLF